jgi:hypothetical protein
MVLIDDTVVRVKDEVIGRVTDDDILIEALGLESKV